MTVEELVDQYEGAFEAWKARLAISRIKALGFPKRDWPDLMQDLALLILKFDYDPTHAKGATEETALYAAINRQLLYRMRRFYRDDRRFTTYLGSREAHVTGEAIDVKPCWESDLGVDTTVRKAVSGLSEFDQAVANGLAAGMTKAALARQLDCEWNTVHKAAGRIREHFEELGIDGEGLR